MRYLRSAWAAVLGLTLCAPPPPAAAQREHRVGVLGGLNAATLVGQGTDAIQDKSNRVGFLLGAFAEFGLSPIISLWPQGYYTMKGVKGDLGGVDAEVKLDWIEVPVLVKLHFLRQESRVRPHLYAGPAIAVRTKCELEGRAGGVTETLDCDDPVLDAEIRSTDIGLLFGGGVAIGPLFVGLRYDMGLVNLDAEPQAEAIRTRAFSILGGMSFPLGRR